MLHHSNLNGVDPVPESSLRRPARPTTGSSLVIGSVSNIRRPISDESWIEVASQPSSSSLSSANTDEVVTTGLRVTQSLNPRRRRRLHRSISEQVQTLRIRTTSTAGSSQEEYEESESESDRIMTSSNEGLPTGFLRDEEESHDESAATGRSPAGEDSGSLLSDDDGNTTALGVAAPSLSIFTPQPTVFSHPPSARNVHTTSANAQDSYFPPLSPSIRESTASNSVTQTTSTGQISSRTHVRTRSHTPYTLMAPNHTVPIDHDAALRASLSTLLSCAAAARGLPKRDSPLDSTTRSPLAPPLHARPTSRIEPGSLRLIPESALAVRQESSSSAALVSTGPPPLPRRPSLSSRSEDSNSPIKRKSKSPSSHDRAAASRAAKKRARACSVSGNDYEENQIRSISPTLMTWVLGAGVMVLFSAISFSAGYALGKEVGRMEAAALGSGVGCAGDVDGMVGRGIGGGTRMGVGMRGRGWRWGNASGIRA